MRALPTGVEIIDHVLGGITPGLPCVLAGPSGAGRTVLSIQVAAAALEAGRVVSLLCNEPAPFLLQQAESLGADLTPWIRSGQLALLEMDADIASTVTALGMDALVEAVEAEQPLGSLLIVDPVTVLTAGQFDEAQLRASARGLVRALGRSLSLLTVEAERLVLQQGLEKILGEVCGSFLTLERNEDGTRRLRVQKTRNGVASADSVAFKIDHTGAQRDAEVPRPTGSDEPADPTGTNGDAAASPSFAALPNAPSVPEADGAVRAAAVSPASAATPETPSPHDSGPLAITAAPGDLQPRILVVDPDRGSRDQLCKWLEGHYEVDTAQDGFEAMSAVLAARPDLVILDLVMPRVTGFELLAAFQRGLDDVPRLVVTRRFERPADRLSPLVLGATDLVAKPLERFELLHKVELLLGLGSRPRQIMDPAEAQALFATPGKSRVMDTPKFHERLERACRFGERFDIPSSLVTVRGETADAIDAVVATAEAGLRFEDAVLRVSARRAVVLLVATPVEDAVGVAERLLSPLGTDDDSSVPVRHEIQPARPFPKGFQWHGLFRSESGAQREPSE